MAVFSVCLLALVALCSSSPTPPTIPMDYSVHVVFTSNESPPEKWVEYQSTLVNANLVNGSSYEDLTTCDNDRYYTVHPLKRKCTNTSEADCPLPSLMEGLENATYWGTDTVNGVKSYVWTSPDSATTYYTAVEDGAPVSMVFDGIRATTLTWDFTNFKAYQPPSDVFDVPSYCGLENGDSQEGEMPEPSFSAAKKAMLLRRTTAGKQRAV
eukprot:TRINITY_DN3497_c0_g1_i1.p1 TRINITY_DN3497_c0_g1~~TRINITY_DN3497_c0_g1_i1.p1  ORF type:complete len:211 (+),score=29.57 TRINITY_DN3497_c0_g1_i1:56-688(+)